MKKQQQQDKINDTFDKLVARLEERRVGLVRQVRMQTRGKLDRLGEPAGRAAD